MRTPVLLLPLTAFILQAASFDQVLDRASKNAERQVSFLASFACTETLAEMKLNAKDKPESQQHHQFDYFVLVDTADGDLSVNESRIEQQGPRKEAKQLAHSTGFAMMALLFHPVYQQSFEFSDHGSFAQKGITFRKIGFRYLPGKRSPTLLKAGAREYPLSWEGETLVEERTGRVKQIEAKVAAELEEIGLKSLDATVEYGPASELGEAEGWAPLKAVVDLRTPHQHWRNIHTFDNFRKFEVSTTEKVADKKK